MVTKSSLIQPPRLAVWLVNLFTPYEQSNSILGDLLEEFSDLASKSGMAFARRWYWRQSVRTVAHLIGSGFRAGPWQIAGVVVVGFLLSFFCGGRLEEAVVAVLNFGRHPHDNPYYTWSQAQARIRLIVYGDLVGHFLLSLFIGCIVALAVKGRDGGCHYVSLRSLGPGNGVVLSLVGEARAFPAATADHPSQWFNHDCHWRRNSPKD